jgi:RimJ/RimL family protein N-acetyltransferase
MIELHPVSVDDAQILFDGWGRHPANFTHLTAHVFAEVGDARKYLAALFPTPESRAYHIVEPGQGVVGIIKAAVTGHRAQVGYVIHQPFWGRGLATSALRQLLTVLEGSPEITRIWATCALENRASARVLEKAGFEREAILKSWVVYPALSARAQDNYSYVKLR